MAEKDDKKKSFKSISDILKIDGVSSASSDDLSFNANSVTDNAIASKINQAKEAVAAMKMEYDKIKNLDDELYTKNVLKMLIEKSMNMLSTIEGEMMSNPQPRALETAAAMVSVINSMADTYKKHNIFNEKMALEREKMEMKKAIVASQKNGPNIGTINNTIVAIGSTTDLLDSLAKSGINISLPTAKAQVKEVDAEVVPDIKNDETDEK